MISPQMKTTDLDSQNDIRIEWDEANGVHILTEVVQSDLCLAAINNISKVCHSLCLEHLIAGLSITFSLNEVFIAWNQFDVVDGMYS